MDQTNPPNSAGSATIETADRHDSNQMASLPYQSIGGSVLVVDDHKPTVQIIVTVLDEIGPSLSVQTVGNGKECLDALRGKPESSLPPDLVLLDLEMPVMGGMTVLETKEEESTLSDHPIIVLSGTDDQDTIDECYEKGANAFITKPDDLDGYTAVLEDTISFWLPG